jgi:hypothetical protein
MSASESSRERGKRRYILFSLSFCAHFLFAALWVLALDPWPFFFFLGRASSSSWGSWALFILFYFILFFFLFAGKRSQKAKKEKCRNGSSSRYMARGRTISTPSNKRNEKKKLMIFFFFDLVPAALPPPKHSECQQQRIGFDVKHLVVLVCCPVFFFDWVGRSPPRKRTQ